MLIESCAHLGINRERESKVKVITTKIVSLDLQICLTLLIGGYIAN